MKISDIEGWVRAFVRNGNDSSRYTIDRIHRTVQSLCASFISETAFLTTTDVSLAGGSPLLPALPTGFTPDRLRRARIVLTTATRPCEDVNLSVTSYDIVHNHNLQNTWTGFPQYLAFDSYTTGEVAPIPKAAYTLRFLWLAPFTAWTPASPLVLPTVSGGAVTSLAVNSPGSTTYGSTPAVAFSGGGGTGATATAVLSGTTLVSISVNAGGTGYTSAPSVLINGVDCTDNILNLPDDILTGGILSDGAMMVLHGTEPENAEIATLASQKYRAWMDHMKSRGAGTLGTQVSYRTPPRGPGRHRVRCSNA